MLALKCLSAISRICTGMPKSSAISSHWYSCVIKDYHDNAILCECLNRTLIAWSIDKPMHILSEKMRFGNNLLCGSEALADLDTGNNLLYGSEALADLNTVNNLLCGSEALADFDTGNNFFSLWV